MDTLIDPMDIEMTIDAGIDNDPKEILDEALEKLDCIIEDLRNVATDMFEYGDVDFGNGLDALAAGLAIKIEKRFSR